MQGLFGLGGLVVIVVPNAGWLSRAVVKALLFSALRARLALCLSVFLRPVSKETRQLLYYLGASQRVSILLKR